jgi:ATP phosphoribosyltransferase
MNGIIAVEKNLSRLVDALETEGYEVVMLDAEQEPAKEVDAIVVSGADINLMNMQDTLTEVPVINAVGKSFNEILKELEKL